MFMELVYRSNNEAVLQADLDELHKMSRFWISEIAFWKDETRFLQKLLGTYFMQLVEEEGTLKHGNMLMESLDAFQNETLSGLLKGVQNHEKHLAVLLENPFHDTEIAYREEHQRLEGRVSGVMKEFQLLKKEIMLLSEHFLHENKHLDLLGP